MTKQFYVRDIMVFTALAAIFMVVVITNYYFVDRERSASLIPMYQVILSSD